MDDQNFMRGDTTIFDYAAIPVEMKEAIAMGSAYKAYRKNLDWLIKVVQDGIMHPKSAFIIQKKNYIYARREGMAHAEQMTQMDPKRYAGLGIYAGTKKTDVGAMELIPQEPDERFFMTGAALFTTYEDIDKHFTTIFSGITPATVEVEWKGRLVEAPRKIVTMYNKLVRSMRNREAIEMKVNNWRIRKHVQDGRKKKLILLRWFNLKERWQQDIKNLKRIIFDYEIVLGVREIPDYPLEEYLSEHPEIQRLVTA